MATVTTIQDILTSKAVGINCTGNGTNTIIASINFPSFDSTFDQNILEDLLIYSANGFATNENVNITINGVTNSYVINTTGHSVWLSEVIGATSRNILASKANEVITFEFTSTKLLEFMVISAYSSDYIDANSTYSGISTATNYYLLCSTEIQSKDENSLSALRSVIDTSKTTITGNGTNVIVITNTFETFGSALDKTLVVDNLIMFNKSLNINTQIYIKKDGVHIDTYTVKACTKSIWLSDLLGGVSRDFLYTKANTETYELTFIYDQYINNQIIVGELTNFTSASVASVQLTQNLFEVANSKTLVNIPIAVDDCNFVITYDSNDNSIKSAVLELNDQQQIDVSFVTDNSGTTPKYLVKLSNVDQLYNISIDLIMDSQAIITYLTLIKNFARRRNELEYIANMASSTSTTKTS
jgi:hypothetical protein